MLASFLSYFNSEDFMPHGHCFLWLPHILWLHVISDALIGIAYYSIPASLLYFVGRRTNLAFRSLFYLTGAFILLCGTTHFISIWVIWHPDYAFEGIVKTLTAGVSILTAVMAWQVIPKALQLKSPADLERVNAQLRTAYENIEQIVSARTSELVAVNERLQKSEGELQHALTAAQAASTAKSDFLANMSHEIRTPMNAVMGLASILAVSTPLTQRQTEYIQTLQLSANSLLLLINDLLDLAKIESHNIELELVPFHVPDLLGEVISMMKVSAYEKGLKLESSIGDSRTSDGFFLGDTTRIRQILLNLCSNAVKFTDSGTVSVTAACETVGDDAVENVVITVQDTGIGIAPDKLDTIFSKFMQADSSISRKYGGTGLGLTITKTLTELMGGTISAESKVGEGSIFKVFLPLQRTTGEVHKKDTAPVANQPDTATQPRILIVEDNAANVLVATEFLEMFGYAYDVAVSGAEAIDRLRGQTYYAAILMDVQMPGVNGHEATRRIRELEKQTKRHRTPIIGMTANAMTGDRELCLNAGMDDYLAKPFNPDDLREKLHKAVHA